MDPIVASYAKDVLDKNSDKILGSVTSFVKKAWEKFKVDFNLAFRTYINQSYDKYSKIKTILYRTEPQFIYDFFEVPYLQKGRKERFLADDVGNVISHSHFIIIEGTGGIGKSTLMKHLFLDTLRRGELIPIFIELKDLNDIDEDYSISDFIFKKLTGLGSTIDKDCLDYALLGGCFVFFLDGYDEIMSDKRDIFYKKLSDLCDQYPENYYIVSSRPYSDFVEMQRFTVLSAIPFTKQQAISLVNNLSFDTEIKKRFVKALDGGMFEKHESFASNPLLLSIMLLTYDNYAEIPDRLHIFYANAFETLYQRHDATKGGFRREFRSKLSFDPFRSVFARFCFFTYFKHKTEFSRDEMMEYLHKSCKKIENFVPEDYLYDLLNSVCVMYKDGLYYRFTHRSFQEFFTAFFLKEQTDENMQKVVLQYIYEEKSSVFLENMLPMLYDMTNERFEICVLLPFLEKLEEELSQRDDAFQYYLSRIISELQFQDLSDMGDYSDVRMFMAVESQNSPYYLAYTLVAKHYYLQIDDDQIEERNFIQYAGQYATIKHEKLHFRVCDFINDNNAVNCMKNMKLGKIINIITHLKDEIEKKQQENKIDFSNLFE